MKKSLLFLVFIFSLCTSFAQSVGIGTSTPDASAQLDVSASNKGFLPPRMSTLQRDAIQNPAPGLQVYNTTTDCLEIFSKGKWYAIFCAPASPAAPDSLTDIDGNSYATVKICDQTWMQKNLNVSRYRNGDIIPQVSNPSDWASLTTGAWCWYNNDSATYGSVYGRLYNWYAVNDPRGLAPAGWHVPSNGEWNKMVKCLDANADTSCQACYKSLTVGGILKETGLLHWIAPNTGAIDSINFKALPNGCRSHDGSFQLLGQGGIWWSSNERNSTIGTPWSVENNNSKIGGDGNWSKTNGLTVRCIKDTPITTLSNGLVAYYPFSGNAGDSSGNGNHGTVNGPTLTTDRFGNSDKAYSFDGFNDEIRVSNRSTLNLMNDFSICAWYKTSVFPSNNNSHTIIAKRDDGLSCCSPNVPYDLQINYTQNGFDYKKPLLAFANGSYHFSQTDSTVSLNKWENVILTYSSDTCRIYLNGKITHSEYFPSSFRSPNSSDLLIGSINRAYGDEYMNGSLDDIRIYNRALTPAEITYLANH